VPKYIALISHRRFTDALRLIRDDRSGPVQYYLPAPGVPESRGGFPYDVCVERIDFAEAYERVIFFANEDDLRRKLSRQDPRKRAVAFLSVGYPAEGAEDTLHQPLLGRGPEVIHPYEEIYRIPFLVRRFELAPGTVAGKALPAP